MSSISCLVTFMSTSTHQTKSIMANHGLGVVHYRLLSSLLTQAHPIELGKLARAIDCSIGNTSKAVDESCSLNLTNKLHLQNDRRKVMVETTNHTRHFVGNVEKAMTKGPFANVWSCLDDREREEILKGLRPFSPGQTFFASSATPRGLTPMGVLMNNWCSIFTSIRRFSKIHKLSVTELRMLLLLLERDGYMSQRDVGCELALTPNEVSKAANAMVLSNLMNREVNARDKRKVILDLTTDGYRRIQPLKSPLENILFPGDFKIQDKARWIHLANTVMRPTNSQPLPIEYRIPRTT